MNAQISNNISSLKTIGRQCTLGLMALVATTASVFTAQSAAAQVTQSKYDAQYTDAPSSLLRLDFDTWNMFNSVVNVERQELTTLDRPQADLSKLRWGGGVQDVEVFFINEGAGYRNQLFYSVDGGTSKNMIFDDISSPLSILPEDGPMKLGQGTSLGSFTGNTFIDFFVKSNGARGGQHFLGFDPDQNPNKSKGLSHVIGYTFDDYLLLGFEDIIGGGDLDFNDVVFVVKGVKTTIPEPSLMIGLIATGAMVVLRKRHHNSEV